MPAYDYECVKCGETKEVFHKISESPSLRCDACRSKMKKAVSGFYLGGGVSSGRDRGDVEDMQADMRENYGVESFKTMAPGGIRNVYSEIKQQGEFVKEQMLAKKEAGDKIQKTKIREWNKGALKRTPARAREKIARRKAEEFSKSRVCVG